jgi:GAF domain-containing protein
MITNVHAGLARRRAHGCRALSLRHQKLMELISHQCSSALAHEMAAARVQPKPRLHACLEINESGGGGEGGEGER